MKKMPNLYQFRQEGMELKNHYTYPTCSPSRAALMTGRNAEKLGKLEISLPHNLGHKTNFKIYLYKDFKTGKVFHIMYWIIARQDLRWTTRLGFENLKLSLVKKIQIGFEIQLSSFQNIWKMLDTWITMSANGILDIAVGVTHQQDVDLIDHMEVLAEECSKWTVILYWLKIGIIRIT